MLMTASSEVLEKVFCIKYLIRFQPESVDALLNSNSKIYAMTPSFTLKQRLVLRLTNIHAQKIDNTYL